MLGYHAISAIVGHALLPISPSAALCCSEQSFNRGFAHHAGLTNQAETMVIQAEDEMDLQRICSQGPDEPNN
ncbi:MAG: hypothetical protein KKD64_07030 [Alphaproteobacteria bacterium]|nr:hypothetical protein [Alphaproteobacteria bacterium]